MNFDLRALLTLDGLHLDHVVLDEQSGRIVVEVHSTTPTPVCPRCGTPSSRTRSTYTRTLADLPWGGRRVVWRLRVRRCPCLCSSCPQRIFAERFQTLTVPFARRTSRLADSLRAVGLALGGRGGERLAGLCSLVVGRKALLTLVRRVPPPSVAAVRVLGMDDWAYRKGQTYGTILVDHESRRVIDLLPDRKPNTLAAWLHAHPGVQIMTRDRAVVYANGIRQGAPETVQVADRWHLLKNLGEAVLRGLLGHGEDLKVAFAEPLPKPGESSAEALDSPELNLMPPQPDVSPHKQAQFDRIHALRAGGRSFRSIAFELQLSRNTVKKYARLDRCPERIRRPRGQAIAAYESYLVERFNAGQRNARRLWEEICTQGFTGSASVVRHYMSDIRRQHGVTGRRDDGSSDRPQALVPTGARRPTLATLAFTVIREPEERNDRERDWMDKLMQTNDEVASVVTLAQQFADMVRRRDPSELGTWLRAATDSGIAALKGFAQGVWSDLEAVREGMWQAWSNGRVEGHVNKLKLVKRQMYGRAKFDLLRARLLAASG
ncbi:ISL3 family transposase [Deinococcus planocerae]|uniref:ISL3 family transposase n=1 Tax=Deinococcus planocerae TaxID=1737569 RepID=UPI000C7EFB28|nr:ISL3 family transposase [Deinococcus planocerae]